jgi:hypothetical protein
MSRGFRLVVNTIFRSLRPSCNMPGSKGRFEKGDRAGKIGLDQSEKPPSTITIVPVLKALSSLAR